MTGEGDVITNIKLESVVFAGISDVKLSYENDCIVPFTLVFTFDKVNCDFV